MWVWERKLSQKLSLNRCSNIISPSLLGEDDAAIQAFLPN